MTRMILTSAMILTTTAAIACPPPTTYICQNYNGRYICGCR